MKMKLEVMIEGSGKPDPEEPGIKIVSRRVIEIDTTKVLYIYHQSNSEDLTQIHLSDGTVLLSLDPVPIDSKQTQIQFLHFKSNDANS